MDGMSQVLLLPCTRIRRHDCTNQCLFSDIEHRTAIMLDTTVDAGCQPLSLITFLLCITAAVGIGMLVLHMLSQLFRQPFDLQQGFFGFQLINHRQRNRLVQRQLAAFGPRRGKRPGVNPRARLGDQRVGPPTVARRKDDAYLLV